jgi:hypothetical protein
MLCVVCARETFVEATRIPTGLRVGTLGSNFCASALRCAGVVRKACSRAIGAAPRAVRAHKLSLRSCTMFELQGSRSSGEPGRASALLELHAEMPSARRDLRRALGE